MLLVHRAVPYAANYDMDILKNLSNLTHWHAHQIWSCDFLQKHTSEVVMVNAVAA